MAGDCLFCRIVAGELPCNEVMSSAATLAFRDINPAMPNHVLVIPKEHVADAAHLGREHSEVLAEMFETARLVAEMEGLAERGYRLVFNVGADSGNTIGHLHLHVLGGRTMGWPPG